VTRDSSRAVWLQRARSYLRHADPMLARLIDDRPDFDPRAWVAQLPPMDLFGAVLFQVTGQQLSVPAARRTLARIEACSAAICPPHRTLGSRSYSASAAKPRASIASRSRTSNAPAFANSLTWCPSACREATPVLRRRRPRGGQRA
jgi:hypothetical protein